MRKNEYLIVDDLVDTINEKLQQNIIYAENTELQTECWASILVKLSEVDYNASTQSQRRL